jgi:acyl carrier protein
MTSARLEHPCEGDEMPGDDVTVRLTTYIQENLRPEGMTEPIDENSRLLELGVLDSLKTAMLLNFIRDDLGVLIPPFMIEFKNFKNAQSISAMVRNLMSESAGQRAEK